MDDNKINYDKLPGKIAADRDSKKLGKIFDVVMIEEKKTRREQPHALVIDKRFLLKDVTVLLSLDRILKTTDRYVWFDISKKEFREEAQETRALMLLMKD
jgi:hypothetical protein